MSWTETSCVYLGWIGFSKVWFIFVDLVSFLFRFIKSSSIQLSVGYAELSYAELSYAELSYAKLSSAELS